MYRLSRLLDPNTPFLELSPLAAYGVYGSETIPGAGIITGIGQISGRQCVVVVNDATVKGGSYYPLTVRLDNTIIQGFNFSILYPRLRNISGHKRLPERMVYPVYT